jgi:hypothetical protein
MKAARDAAFCLLKTLAPLRQGIWVERRSRDFLLAALGLIGGA